MPGLDPLIKDAGRTTHSQLRPNPIYSGDHNVALPSVTRFHELSFSLSFLSLSLSLSLSLPYSVPQDLHHHVK